MKKAVQLFTSVFLSLAVLAVSGGFTLSKMTCLATGHRIVAMSQQGECCKKETGSTAAIRSKCCSIFNQDLGLGHFFSSFTKVDLKQHPIVFYFHSNVLLMPVSKTISSVELNTVVHPPPLAGVDLLYSIHKLTV